MRFSSATSRTAWAQRAPSVLAGGMSSLLSFMLRRFLQRLNSLEQPVQCTDDCPTKEEHNRVQFRPQRQPQGYTGNADMHLACEGSTSKMEAVTTSKPTTAGAAPRPKCRNSGCCIHRRSRCAAAAASAHGITKIPNVAAKAPASLPPDSRETSW